MTDILIGRNESTSVSLDPQYGNRHGMIAGATGTGKSVSLMVLAEGFSKLGVPCFLADAKGDLAGLAMAAGDPGDTLKARLAKLGLNDWKPQANPVIFWDIYGKLGHPVRATISEMGPTLLGRILELNDTQEGVLEVIFKVADDQGWLLLDLPDLRAMLGFAAENAKTISTQYGLISTQSIAAIQRNLLKLEQDGADQFFGEPALELSDLMRQDMSGRGVINVLAADQLILKPRLYSTFLLWLLSELFEQLPEVGDLEQPKLVFFFDEAHLLFDDAPAALQQRVEQVVRLIRSKGVGVYFCSQNPDDVPGNILGQLGNRVQHALRAFTPRDQKAVKAAAETFVANPKLKVGEAITQLAVGEALASTLRDGGVPTPVEQVLVSAPTARIGAITETERATVRQRSPVGGKYDTAVNRESAAEILAQRAEHKTAEVAAGKDASGASESPGWGGAIKDALLGTSRRQGMIEAMAKSASRTVGTRIGQQIVRGVLGSIFGGKR
ncbi:helicase HerA-like domain-containing protein [Dyella silvatica]|uniref:helicase HerA-like domain-containing protein n=1 Tax=Dyella silvatica TaxID=2992128 RepID=UPI0022598C1D|nr:helicase HerA-like domain-containing protein [Dyella silvatica]